MEHQKSDQSNALESTEMGQRSVDLYWYRGTQQPEHLFLPCQVVLSMFTTQKRKLNQIYFIYFLYFFEYKKYMILGNFSNMYFSSVLCTYPERYVTILKMYKLPFQI